MNRRCGPFTGPEEFAITRQMAVASATTADEVRRQIEARIRYPRLSTSDVAYVLDCSRSAVQRALSKESTTFGTELQAVREDRARTALVLEKRTVSAAAAQVGVTPDHLRVLLKPIWGVNPGDVRRVVILLQRIRSWRRAAPPAARTQAYRTWRREWDLATAEISRLLEPVRADCKLRGWADSAQAYSRRPDFRREPYRGLVEEARRRERRQLSMAIQEALAATGWSTSTSEAYDELP